MSYLEHYTLEQMRRHAVVPGITGLAQVSGRNNLSWEQKFALDVWYVDHRSLWLDLKVLAMTVHTVLGWQGVSAPGCLSAPKFLGATDRDSNHAAAGHNVKGKKTAPKPDVSHQPVNDN